jgi:hypothetical protein
MTTSSRIRHGKWAAILATAALVGAAGTAQAGDVSWSVSINAPVAPGVTVGTVISDGYRHHAPVVYAPAPVVYAPPPVVYTPPPRVVYAPPPVYVTPAPRVVVRPQPVYLPAPVPVAYGHWLHRVNDRDDRRCDERRGDHRHDRHDRRDDDRWQGRSDGWRR